MILNSWSLLSFGFTYCLQAMWSRFKFYLIGLHSFNKNFKISSYYYSIDLLINTLYVSPEIRSLNYFMLVRSPFFIKLINRVTIPLVSISIEHYKEVMFQLILSYYVSTASSSKIVSLFSLLLSSNSSSENKIFSPSSP